MANFGDTISIDNSNPFIRMTDFKELIDDFYYQLTGQRHRLVTKILCNIVKQSENGDTEMDEKGNIIFLPRMEYIEPQAIEREAWRYIPVLDSQGNRREISNWEDTRDPNAVALCNDRGANYIKHELSKFYNDKILFGNVSRDELIDSVSNAVGGTIHAVIVDQIEYEVKSPYRLMNTGSIFLESMYTYLSGVCEGKTRDAIIQILTGGGIQYREDKSEKPPGIGEKLAEKFGSGK